MSIAASLRAILPTITAATATPVIEKPKLQPNQWWIAANGNFAKVHDEDYRSTSYKGQIHVSFKVYFYQTYKGSPFDYWRFLDNHIRDPDCPAPSANYELTHLLDAKGNPIPPPASGPEKHIEDLFRTLSAMQGDALNDLVVKNLDKYQETVCSTIAERILPTIQSLITDQIHPVVAKHVECKRIEVSDHGTIRVIESPHPKLQDAIEISSAINNLWLCGPAGSGKTTLARQLSEALGTQFAFISCTTGMSESKILGRMNVHGSYLPAEFVRIYEEGGVFLWDEFDAADPNVVLCANAAMANGQLAVPDRIDKPVAQRHAKTILVIATNTWGRGSTSEYNARESLDAATRDRFVLSKIEVGYSPIIEAQYLGSYRPASTPESKAFSTELPLQEVFSAIRANIAKHHLRRVLSTRTFAQAAALRAIGWSDQRILDQYFLDWTPQEVEKAKEGIK